MLDKHIGELHLKFFISLSLCIYVFLTLWHTHTRIEFLVLRQEVLDGSRRGAARSCMITQWERNPRNSQTWRMEVWNERERSLRFRSCIPAQVMGVGVGQLLGGELSFPFSSRSWPSDGMFGEVWMKPLTGISGRLPTPADHQDSSRTKLVFTQAGLGESWERAAVWRWEI